MTFAMMAPALAAILLPAAAGAAQNETDKLFEAVAAYRFGQDEAPLIAVAEAVRRSHDDPQKRRPIEEALVKVLQTGTPDAKRFVCLQLWMAASARSVPAVAKLLADPELADAARYALERMTGPAAGKALRDALRTAKGPVLVGVVNSLGHRRDKDAAALLVPLLGIDDEEVPAAAAWALGRIGGTDAAKALTATRLKAAGRLRRVLDDACLLCADALAADGKASDAAAIYRQMYAADQPGRVRIAALRGLMVAQPDQAAPLALAAMKGPDAHLGAVAGALLRKLPGEAITQALADELPKLPADGKVAMLEVLARRGGPAARPAVLAAAGDKDEPVRQAALLALGAIGTAEDVPRLAELACAGSGAVPDAARASLTRLGGQDVAAALVALAKKSPPPVAAELIRILAARYAGGTVPYLLQAAADNDPGVRAASLAALAALAEEKDLPALVTLVVKAPTDADRAAAGRALAAVGNRAKDEQAAAGAVLDALVGAPPATRCALLAVLPILPSPRGLAALRDAVKDADGPVRDAAVRALADWPGPEALDDLLALAGSAGGVHKIIALRGAVRLLGVPSDRELERIVALYARLLKLADRPDEKKLALAGLAQVGRRDALELVRSLLADPQLKAEAQAAAVRIAVALAGADHDLAAGVIQKVIAEAASEAVKADAAAALRRINENRDYILTWMLSGPYVEKGKDGPALFDVAFPPETPGAKGVRWRPVTATDGPALDLRSLVGGENRAVYLRATVVSPSRQQAVLELGSDDGVKAWLNGKRIHANNASRGLTPGQDKVNITLQAGENELMLEIINGGTDWGATARIVGPDGKPLPALRTLAR